MGRDFLQVPIVIQKEELAKQLLEKEKQEQPKPIIPKNSELMVNHEDAFKDTSGDKPYNKMNAVEKKQYRTNKKKEEKEAKKKIKDEIKLNALKEKEELKAKKRQESYERKKAKDRERYYARKKASEEEEKLKKQLEAARLLAPPQPIHNTIEKVKKVAFAPDELDSPPRPRRQAPHLPPTQHHTHRLAQQPPPQYTGMNYDQFAGFMDRYNRETGKLREVEHKKIEIEEPEQPKHNDYDPWGLARNYRNLNSRPF
tara:strand:+ start:863 stop:1630 length:768 start_codon:yes stop_codon:yes gene_type:complete